MDDLTEGMAAMPVQAGKDKQLDWRPVALLVAAAYFMENLDGTIIVTATQRMARSFGVPAGSLNLAIAAYLLALGAFIPVSGWLADRFGARRVFGGAIVMFTLTSALCAASGSLGELVAMRVLQGIGGAMMVPVGRLVVLRATAKDDLINAVAYLTWPALVAPVIAPVIGGALTTYASWRYIFVVNVPLGFVALVITLRLVREPGGAAQPRLDWTGFALVSSGLGLVVGGLETLTLGNSNWASIVAAVMGGALILSVAARHLCRTDNPLLQLGVLRTPTFRVTNLGGSLFRMAVAAAPFLLPLLFQEEFGWSPVRSSLVVVPIFVGNIAIKPFTTRLLRQFGFRRVLVASGAALGATLALCSTFSAGVPLSIVVTVLFASGLFRSVGFTAYNTIVFADIGPDQLGNANTLTTTVQQLTMGLGVAVGGLALRLGAPVDRLLGVAETGRSPFVVAFLLLAALSILGALECAYLPRHAGSTLTVKARRAP